MCLTVDVDTMILLQKVQLLAVQYRDYDFRMTYLKSKIVNPIAKHFYLHVIQQYKSSNV